jgi:hypothetical protein
VGEEAESSWRKYQSPNRSALSIIVLARNYMLAKKKPHAKPKEGWRKPLEGKLMINVDAVLMLIQERVRQGWLYETIRVSV